MKFGIILFLAMVHTVHSFSGSSHVQPARRSSFKAVRSLPDGWAETTDKATGKPYWWNKKTREVTWYKPGEQFEASPPPTSTRMTQSEKESATQPRSVWASLKPKRREATADSTSAAEKKALEEELASPAAQAAAAIAIINKEADDAARVARKEAATAAAKAARKEAAATAAKARAEALNNLANNSLDVLADASTTTVELVAKGVNSGLKGDTAASGGATLVGATTGAVLLGSPFGLFVGGVGALAASGLEGPAGNVARYIGTRAWTSGAQLLAESKLAADKAAAEAIAVASKLAREAAAKAEAARAAEAAVRAAKARTEVGQAADLAAATYATELNKRALGPPSAAVLTLFAEIVDAQLGKVLPSNTLESASAPGAQRKALQSLSFAQEPLELTQAEAPMPSLSSSTTTPTSVATEEANIENANAQKSSEQDQTNVAPLSSPSTTTGTVASADGDMARLRDMLLDTEVSAP